MATFECKKEYIMDKITHLYEQWKALQPLSKRKEYLLSQRFTVDYNYNSNHIEGNTLTYGQTELLLLFGKVSGEGNIKDFMDMKASEASIQMLKEELSERKPLTQHFIRLLHQTLLREDYTVYQTLPDGTISSYIIHAGSYKTRPNSVITRYGDRFEYASPQETPALMTDLVDWYNEAETTGKLSVVELATLFHYRYIRIHPFEDGNGRIARLMVNYILARHGLPMLVVRHRYKQQYLDALHQADIRVGLSPSEGAQATLAQIAPFSVFFKKLVATELQYIIDFATETSAKVWWYDGQRIVFRSPSTAILLTAIEENPMITIEQLAQKAGIAPAAVKKQLQQMTLKGYIQRKETDGSLRIFATTSI